ncbi:MAG TPA: HAMP domain-containing sensor histidine kinase [Agriterribacter sp.]|nr:HAMP domain-containing sensor histidine kinase [Agriterribacter sp.]
MKKFWSDILYNNGYLLIGAAWLFTLSFIFSNYWSYTSSPGGVKKSLEKYIWQNEQSFDSFLRDTLLIGRLLSKTETESEVKEITEKQYKVFLYEENVSGNYNLLFWNTQTILPGNDLLQKEQQRYIASLSNGQYEVIRKKISYQGRIVIALYLLPIRRQYVLESEYLKNGFVNHSHIEENYALVFTPTEYPIQSNIGSTLFYLQPKSLVNAQSSDWLTLLLRILGSLLVLFFLHNVAVGISRSWGAVAGVSFMLVLMIGLRTISYFFQVPANFRQFELFDPSVYGSNLISRSLGDLLINSILFFWLVLFARIQFSKHNIRLRIEDILWRRTAVVLLTTVLVIATIIGGHVIRSLVADSQISFDVTNFFSLNIYSVFGFIVLCCVSLGYFIFSQGVLKVIGILNRKLRYNQLLIIAIVGLLGLSIRVSSAYVLFELSVLIWLLLYVYLLGKVELSVRRSNFLVANALFWLFIFSASIASVIIVQNRTRELELRKRTAEKLVIQADPSSERLLNIAIQSFSNNFFIDNLVRLHDPAKNARFKDSLINANFAPYLNKYDTELFFYDANERPIANGERLTFDELNTIYSVQGKNTKIPGLRYYETAFDKFSYIYLKPIKDSLDATKAYFFMLANPKRYRSEALYPELFRQTEDYSFEYTPDYAYAIYDSGALLVYVNDYSFPTALTEEDIPKEEFSEKTVNGYSELWYKAGDKVTILTRRSSFIMEAITLFAYLFVSFLLLVALFQVASIIIQSGFRWRALREIMNFNIRSQIYGTVIFVSVFSFIVVGAATILFYTASYNKNNRDKLSRSIQDISTNLKNKISDHRLMDDFMQVYDSAYGKAIRQQITDMAQAHNADINLYNSDGSLQISSQPFVYNKGVLSRMMDPLAFYNLSRQKKIQFVQEEQYGSMKYLSIYVPVMGDSRKALGYLNIPYFNSQNRLKQEISSFLVTIINLNAFIFLLSGIIALFLTNRITGSFSLIRAMMKDVNLGKHNAEIVWTKRDEIGGLVKEYNKMVQKLEESAVALAKTEREGAWREMARQVAHEIKNPLTPMKLSIQYLQKAINNNAPNVKELSSNVAQTLVEQIDHLSRIASEFSQFANIGNAKNEVFDINQLLNSLVYLHDVQEKVAIEWEPREDPLLVDADKTQINRLFTNLLQNAIEAIPENENGVVKINESRDSHHLVISIGDNGLGIPKAILANIFTPNFTTKTSGTGLGLAICKGIVEQSKGNIWFDTEEGKGTTFYVELPVYENGTLA